MYRFLLPMFLLLSCAQVSVTDYDNSLSLLQQIWDTQRIDLAYKTIEDLKQTEEDDDYQTLGVPRGSGASPLNIYVSKKNKKISGIVLSVYGDDKRRAAFVKSQIIATDWKIFEHPVKDHPLRTEIAEYSESRGVSFLYDKLDSKQKVRAIYWGSDPKKINW
jgi:hypothetical protein